MITRRCKNGCSARGPAGTAEMTASFLIPWATIACSTFAVPWE
jgi:hypothetical protein